MDKNTSFLNYFPNSLKKIIETLNSKEMETLNEIIVINGQPLVVRINGIKYYLGYQGICQTPKNSFYVDSDHIKRIFELITKSSVYTYKRFIKEGFLTLDGGHRVGIVGNYINDINNISSFSDINSLCFRISHNVRNVADIVIDDIFINGNIENTIIISPPGSGKTTLLRSIAQHLVIYSGKIITATVIDERYEIAACTDGKANFDVGISTSVISGCKKSIAIPLVVRSMTPDLILTDEIATLEDIKAVKYAKASGCSIIATAHGINENCCILSKTDVHDLFNKIIILSSKNGPGTIEKIIRGG